MTKGDSKSAPNRRAFSLPETGVSQALGGTPPAKVRMNILVSACLLGHCCKYNGGHNRNERVLAYVRGHTVIPVCPEQLGGLPTPRACAELLDERIVTDSGQDVTAAFQSGADMACRIAVRGHAELAILQPRSPSCGVHQIYDGSFQKRLINGQGVFAARLAQLGIRAVEPDELP